MRILRVAIGNYSPGGFGGVNAHIYHIVEGAAKYPGISVSPFYFRRSRVDVASQSLHEFFSLRSSPYIDIFSKRFCDFDVVHVHASLFALYSALAARNRFGPRVVVTIHGAANPDIILKSIEGYPYPKRVFYRRVLMNLLEESASADAVIAVAKWVQRDLKGYWGTKAEYIRI